MTVVTQCVGAGGLWTGYLLYEEINVSDACIHDCDKSGGGSGMSADRDGV